MPGRLHLRVCCSKAIAYIDESAGGVGLHGQAAGSSPAEDRLYKAIRRLLSLEPGR